MTRGIFSEWKENALLLVKNPKKLFNKAKKMKLERAILLATVSYGAAGGILGAVLGAILAEATYTPVNMVLWTVAFLLLGLVVGSVAYTIGLVTWSFITYLCMKVGGGEGTFEKTISVLALLAPFSLAESVVVAFLILTLLVLDFLEGTMLIVLVMLWGASILLILAIAVWNIYLQVKGLSIVHNTSTMRTFFFGLVLPTSIQMVISVLSSLSPV